ncbi:TlpA disulfide reductase family protein [uncultured Algibacter sp.]|uniref:TlpA disulfide reductase family protein n=1 Tax=uncultured Algibacter sp. TaxID=298659 RepID=UPI00261BB112|nr:TlpA disulfide reductase family protein [uncultured Algibacter sp.]
MKIIYKLILSIYFVISITACVEKERKKEKFTILGQISGFPDGTKFYLRNLATDAVFDSTTVENNSFKFEGHLSSPPEQIWLNATVDKKFIYTNLLIGNDNITVKGDISDFPWNVNIRGSKTQEDFNYSQSLTKENNIKRNSLVQTFMNLPQEKQREIGAGIWKKIRTIDSATQISRINYIKSHPNTYISIIELGYLKNQLPKDTIQKIFKNYTPEIKESKYAKVVEVFLRENIAKIGDKFHDFEGINQKGEKVKFSNIRGEYTLLDFTAAYCGPCIKAADELVEINKEYSDSLKIVSFTQDPKKDVWLKSLERDKVTWNSIWDGKGRYSETSIKYGIQGIPTFVLINPEGTIIDKWTGYSKGNLISKIEKKIIAQNNSYK